MYRMNDQNHWVTSIAQRNHHDCIFPIIPDHTLDTWVASSLTGIIKTLQIKHVIVFHDGEFENVLNILTEVTHFLMYLRAQIDIRNISQLQTMIKPGKGDTGSLSTP